MQTDVPSKTALKVARSVLALGATRHADSLPVGLVESTGELLRHSGLVSPLGVRWASSTGMALFYRVLDVMMPGIFRSFGERKRFMEEAVRVGISDGCRQVLMVGAGLDTLCWRMARMHPEVLFVEVLHPAMATPKRRALGSMGLPENLTLVAADLEVEDLGDALALRSGWEIGLPSMAVAEGLLQYLDPSSVKRLFCRLREVSGPASRLSFSHPGWDSEGARPRAGWLAGPMHRIFQDMGEPWLWGVEPEDLDSFLAEVGWTSLPKQGALARVHEWSVEHYALAAT